jgi:hypothetical protein
MIHEEWGERMVGLCVETWIKMICSRIRRLPSFIIKHGEERWIGGGNIFLTVVTYGF